MKTIKQTVSAQGARMLEAQPIPLEGIRLTAGGGGWMGTFYGLVRFALEDLLSDGEPIKVRLLVEQEGYGDDPIVVDGVVTATEDHFARFMDGSTVDLNEVTGLWVN